MLTNDEKNSYECDIVSSDELYGYTELQGMGVTKQHSWYMCLKRDISRTLES